MNSANLLRVADAIEKHEIEWLGFNMTGFVAMRDLDDDLEIDNSGHNCGTTACVAGWAFAVDRQISCGFELESYDFGRNVMRYAASFLGLNIDQAEKLFAVGPTVIDRNRTTAKQAVRTLRYAAKHGVIDWDKAQEEGSF